MTAVTAEFNGTPLPLATDITASRKRNDLGAWSLTLPRTDPLAPTVLSEPGIVRILLDGTPRFAGIVGDPTQDTVSRSEESGERLTIEGVSTLGLWADDVLGPEGGTGRRSSPDERFFGPQTILYVAADHTGWDTADQIKQVFAATPAQWREELGPQGWSVVAANAWWIAANAQGVGDEDTPPQPVGNFWVILDVEVELEGDYATIATADDGFPGVWVGGNLILSRVEAFMWGLTVRADDVFLEPGTYRLCMKVENITRESVATNITGALMAFGNSEDGGTKFADPVLAVTDSSWLAWDETVLGVPGMTAGEIVYILKEELFPDIDLGFTRTEDSNGDPWEKVFLLSFPVGTTALDVLRVLAEQGVDLRMRPDSETLDMWNRGGGDTGPDAEWFEGVNIAEDGVRHTQVRPQLTEALARCADGRYVTSERPGVWRRVRQFLSLGTAESPEQAVASMEPIFDEQGEMHYEAMVDVRHTGDLLAEMAELDTVSAPAMTTGQAVTRVDEVVLAVDDVGQPMWRFVGRQEAPVGS